MSRSRGSRKGRKTAREIWADMQPVRDEGVRLAAVAWMDEMQEVYAKRSAKVKAALDAERARQAAIEASRGVTKAERAARRLKNRIVKQRRSHLVEPCIDLSGPRVRSWGNRRGCGAAYRVVARTPEGKEICQQIR